MPRGAPRRRGGGGWQTIWPGGSGSCITVHAMIAKAAPSSTSSPRTTIPPPASGVFLKAYSLYAMDAEATWEPTTVELDPEEMVATDISELLGDAHDAHDTLRPLRALLAERMGTAAREIDVPRAGLSGQRGRAPGAVCLRDPRWFAVSRRAGPTYAIRNGSKRPFHGAITRHGCPRSRRRFAC